MQKYLIMVIRSNPVAVYVLKDTFIGKEKEPRIIPVTLCMSYNLPRYEVTCDADFVIFPRWVLFKMGMNAISTFNKEKTAKMYLEGAERYTYKFSGSFGKKGFQKYFSEEKEILLRLCLKIRDDKPSLSIKILDAEMAKHKDKLLKMLE